MREILTIIFFVTLFYLIVGVGLWWQWRNGAMIESLKGYPDDAETFVLIATQWPMAIF